MLRLTNTTTSTFKDSKHGRFISPLFYLSAYIPPFQYRKKNNCNTTFTLGKATRQFTFLNDRIYSEHGAHLAWTRTLTATPGTSTLQHSRLHKLRHALETPREVARFQHVLIGRCSGAQFPHQTDTSVSWVAGHQEE